MDSAISETAGVSVRTEIVNKKPPSSTSRTTLVAKADVVQASSKPGLENTSGIKKAVNESAVPEKSGMSQNESRKIDVNDGEIKTKVYDEHGELLRVIPPGYLPAGEQKFEVTV